MRMYKPRGLNVDESYACSRTAVRKCFEKQEISILWGTEPMFKFDFQMRRRSQIDGTVVASISSNYHMQDFERRNTLRFYIFSDPSYNHSSRQMFEDSILPHLYEWHCAHTDPRIRSGVDQILVIWKDGSFSMQELHFA